MKNILRNTLLVAALAALVCVPAMAQKPENAAGRTGVVPARGPGVLLYDQTDFASGNGAPDQDFEAAFDAYDSEGADDFLVAAPGWAVERVVTVGTYSGANMCSPVRVDFYLDAAGVPAGATTCSFPGLVPTADAAGSLTLDLPASCNLAAGNTYWVAIQCSMTFGGGGGQHFWSNRTATSNSGAVWRNPGDGFGTGCVNFTPMSVCGVGGGFPDFLFQIWGVDVPVTLQSFDVE